MFCCIVGSSCIGVHSAPAVIIPSHSDAFQPLCIFTGTMATPFCLAYLSSSLQFSLSSVKRTIRQRKIQILKKSARKEQAVSLTVALRHEADDDGRVGDALGHAVVHVYLHPAIHVHP